MSLGRNVPALMALAATLCSAFVAACSSVQEFVPARTLVTSDHVEILMADPCGTGSYGTENLISFNQLAIMTPQGIRRPLTFAFRKQGRTTDEAGEGSSLLGNYLPLVMNACGDFREGPNAEYRNRALDVADRAIILVVEAGLRLERATSSEEFGRILEEENRRKEELYESAGKLSPYYFMMHN